MDANNVILPKGVIVGTSLFRIRLALAQSHFNLAT